MESGGRCRTSSRGIAQSIPFFLFNDFSGGKRMDEKLAIQLIKVAERAAISCARTMGRGDRKDSDLVAVREMRKVFNDIDIRGTVVIGEGERDEAPMLYIGEQVGTWAEGAPEVDIAVDPLEGTNLCATGSPGAITIVAIAEKGGLLNAPDIYLDKLVVSPSAKGRVDINASVRDNINAIADSLNYDADDLVVVVLDRPRHEQLINEIREAGARIKLISDGDLSAAISTVVRGTGVHAVMGSGGAPEGVLSAAAIRCLGGEIQGKFSIFRPKDAQRLNAMGITDHEKVYFTEDLAGGSNIILAATGVTTGELIRGVRFFGGGARTQSMLLNLNERTVRFVDTIHKLDEFSGPIFM